jgi:RNA polymerase sigma-70 factor (ECF subfamily)
MKKLTTYSDASLIALYRRDQNAEYVGELYKRYALSVFGLCYKYLKDEQLAKDAMSEIFELVIRKLNVQEVTYFRSWVYIVSKNHLIRLKNRLQNNETIRLDNISEKFMENEMDLSLNIKELKDKLLEFAVQQLKEEQRKCIELFYLQEKNYNEVAALTGYDVNSVKSYIQNGKRNLKLLMKAAIQRYE